MKFLNIILFIFISISTSSLSETLEFEGGTYTGDTKKPCLVFCEKIPHGYGTLKIGNEIYRGNWVEGRKHGRGIYKNPTYDISRFEGHYENDAPKGNGYINYNSNHIYQGSINAVYKPHGIGTMTYNNGDVFKGYFQYGKIVKGEMKYNDGSIFDGSFNNEGKPDLNNGKWTQKTNGESLEKNSNRLIWQIIIGILIFGLFIYFFKKNSKTKTNKKISKDENKVREYSRSYEEKNNDGIKTMNAMKLSKASAKSISKPLSEIQEQESQKSKSKIKTMQEILAKINKSKKDEIEKINKNNNEKEEQLTADNEDNYIKKKQLNDYKEFYQNEKDTYDSKNKNNIKKTTWIVFVGTFLFLLGIQLLTGNHGDTGAVGHIPVAGVIAFITWLVMRFRRENKIKNLTNERIKNKGIYFKTSNVRSSGIPFVDREIAIFFEIHKTNILKILLITLIVWFIFLQSVQLLFYDLASYGPPIILRHLIDAVLVSCIVWFIAYVVRRIRFNKEIELTYVANSSLSFSRNRVLIILGSIIIIGASIFIFTSANNERTAYCDYKFNGFSGSAARCNDMLNNYHEDKLTELKRYFYDQGLSYKKLFEYVCTDFDAHKFELWEVRSCFESLNTNLDIAIKNKEIRKRNEELNRQYSESGGSSGPSFGQILGLGLGILGGFDALRNPDAYQPYTLPKPNNTPSVNNQYGNKICYYDCLGTIYTLNIDPLGFCPLQASFGDSVDKLNCFQKGKP